MGLPEAKQQFNFRLTTPAEIRRVYSKITSNATGPDGLPPKCFKLMADYISGPISTIINSSFISGYFPSRLKCVSVAPIPKVENPSSLNQFRPISNANYLLKIISTISCQQLTGYLDENHLISADQSGFRRAHSCTTAILKLTEDIHKSISGGKCVILVLLDFSNAFGSVDHDRLMQCLKSVGISNHSMQWFKSFIGGWHQIVKHNGGTSKSLPITRGIIQGENNSQLFFSIFINHVGQYIKTCNAIMFADDVQIYIECDIQKVEDGIKIINNEIKNIEKFCREFCIEINPSKTKAIIISSKNNLNKLNYDGISKINVNGNAVEFVDSARNLGYYLNRTATSTDHTRIIQQKIYGSLSSLTPLKSIIPSDIKLQLFKTLILPIFDYMDIVYHNYGIHGSIGEGEKLERLQNTCIRYILNVNRGEHITPHRESLQLMKMHDRRTLHVAGMVNKILNGGAPPYLSNLISKNTNNTRSKNKLIIKMPSSNFHKSSFYIGAPKLWNEIPSEIREITEFDNFKSEYMDFLLPKQ